MEYSILGNTGVWVSKICLGTMTFGGVNFWETIGRLQQEEVNDLVRTAFDEGVNFIDTANIYSEGKSELLLGNAIRLLDLPRQQLFIATKVRGRTGKGPNQVGLSRLHIMDAVNDSLARLQMDHIDLLYIHGVDVITSYEETMRGLEDIVRSGKVRYIGCSNIPAWQVMKANGISERSGWTRFIALQYYYSLATRDIEKEIIPMAESENLALMPWSPLAGGFLAGKFKRESGKAEGEARRNTFDFPPIDKEKTYTLLEKMTDISCQHNASIAQVALAWLLHKRSVTSVIIGARSKDQLLDNLKSTDLKLSTEEMNVLDELTAIAMDYPHWMIERQNTERLQPQG
ncbi:MAG: aldo/keto reductase [Bacteroidetes bacterium]|nr:aldo/keto reductase [Bacteroidota bacterium]